VWEMGCFDRHRSVEEVEERGQEGGAGRAGGGAWGVVVLNVIEIQARIVFGE
jgi:hypothetical protein